MEPTKPPWTAEDAAHPAQQQLKPLAGNTAGTPTAALKMPAPASRARVPSAAMPSTVPEPSSMECQPAQRRIHSQEDLRRFLRSDALNSFLAFLRALNSSVEGKPISAAMPVSPAVEAIQTALQSLWDSVDAIPPAAAALRYGNPAYRTWFQSMAEKAPSTLQHMLPESLSAAVPELSSYWSDSFGNSTRIDYGTGHETTFVAFLYCLARLGFVGKEDAPALVLRVFTQYIRLMRRIQTTYWLEPAGSHGVWGLDDYQFLPFLWGAAQLIGHPTLQPDSIHQDATLKQHAPDYLYMAAVEFVRQVKKGPLAETSPMINDISGVPNWSKVNSGMFKMYHAELLSKLPIMQHFLFGSLLPFQ